MSLAFGLLFGTFIMLFLVPIMIHIGSDLRWIFFKRQGKPKRSGSSSSCSEPRTRATFS